MSARVPFDMRCNWYRSLGAVNEVCDLNGEHLSEEEGADGVGV